MSGNTEQASRALATLMEAAEAIACVPLQDLAAIKAGERLQWVAGKIDGVREMVEQPADGNAKPEVEGKSDD